MKPAWAPSQSLPFAAGSLRIPVAPADTRHPVAIARREIPHRRNSLTAASKVLEKAKTPITEAYGSQTLDWQKESWGFYAITGELRYAANLFGNGMSRVEMYLSKKSDSGPSTRLFEAKKLNSTDKLALQCWEEITAAQNAAEMLRLAGILLFVAGEGLLVGLPKSSADRTSKRSSGLMDYQWVVRSRDDVRKENGLLCIDGVEYAESSVILVKFWRPDPQFHRMPDSPTRGVLPILRELNGLTMYVSAIIDSRLAGAGMLILPNSATVLGATAPEDDQEEDPTVAAIIEAMITPIKNRDSAASVVPFIVTVPDDCADLIRHISFASPLDGIAKDLRDELIRRLALGFDMPAEQLLGMALAAGSHWGAWQVSEDTVRLHYMPGVHLFATAVLTDLLIPMLIESGVDEAEAHRYFFELDGEGLVSRPNQFTEALELYKLGALKLSTLLAAGGFEATDAPEDDNAQVDRATELALKMVSVNPNLFADPGLPVIVSQLRSALAGEDASNAPADTTPPAQAPAPSEGRPNNPQQGIGERGSAPTDNNPGPPTPGKGIRVGG